MKKRVFPIILAILCLSGFISCGSKNTITTKSENVTEKINNEEKIEILIKSVLSGESFEVAYNGETL